MVSNQDVREEINSPDHYKRCLQVLIQDARNDIKTVLLSHYNGEYIYSQGSKKLTTRSGICASAVFRLKVMGDDILYSTMMLNREGDVSYVSQNLYQLPDADVFGIYQDLYEITYGKDESI